jgi:hypothetical protein
MTRRARRPQERFLRLAASLSEEIARIDRTVEEAARARKRFASRAPSALELRGLGAIVHDFYTGVERVFMKIAPELNGGVPAGLSWHRELLQNMTLDLANIRPPLLRKESAQALEEFLRFRHLFRNLYGFELEWKRIQPLLRRLPSVWSRVRNDFDRFLEFLRAAEPEDSAE